MLPGEGVALVKESRLSPLAALRSLVSAAAVPPVSPLSAV